MANIFKQIVILTRPSAIPERARLKGVVTFLVLIYITSLLGLIQLWYQTDTNIPFHWFDDAAEWLGMDKLGHAWVTFIEAHIVFRLFKWAGYRQKKFLWLSCIAPFVSQSSYEIFDGYSAGYGASVYDLIANAAGALFFVIQLSFSHKLLISFKFSFFKTAWAAMRPNLLGSNTIQQIIKDYNGQTYWFSIDLNQLTGKKLFPSWLTFCVGYGADGLLGGHDNIWDAKDGTEQDYSHIARTSQWFISLDILPQNISEGKPLLKLLLSPFEYIKIPAPALSVGAEGIKWHWIYF